MSATHAAPRLGFGERPAVLVVDFIDAFADTSGPFGCELGNEIAATARVLDAARAADIPVMFTTVAYTEADIADAGLWAIKVPHSTELRAGTPAVEVVPQLGRRDGEPVIAKRFASAFFGTDLLERLRAEGIDTVVLMGCTTSGCVRATAIDGLQNGIRTLVVREGVGDRDPAAHAQNLADIDRKYGDVISEHEAIEGLRAARATAVGG